MMKIPLMYIFLLFLVAILFIYKDFFAFSLVGAASLLDAVRCSGKYSLQENQLNKLNKTVPIDQNYTLVINVQKPRVKGGDIWSSKQDCIYQLPYEVTILDSAQKIVASNTHFAATRDMGNIYTSLEKQIQSDIEGYRVLYDSQVILIHTIDRPDISPVVSVDLGKRWRRINVSTEKAKQANLGRGDSLAIFIQRVEKQGNDLRIIFQDKAGLIRNGKVVKKNI